MAPTVDNVATCLGILTGLCKKVCSPEEFGRLWSDRGAPAIERVQLRTNVQRDRMYLYERLEESPARGSGSSDGTLTLELVMSERLNHAFAIHHATTPRWQPSAAFLAVTNQTNAWWCAPAAPRSDEPMLPLATLLPSLLQPALRDPRCVARATDESVLRKTQREMASEGTRPIHICSAEERRWRRLCLLSCNPADPAAISVHMLAMIDLLVQQASALDALLHQPATDESSALASLRCERHEDETLAAQVLARSGGLPDSSDDLLVQLAERIADSKSTALREAALIAGGPLAAPVALLWARKHEEDRQAVLISWTRNIFSRVSGKWQHMLQLTWWQQTLRLVWKTTGRL